MKTLLFFFFLFFVLPSLLTRLGRMLHAQGQSPGARRAQIIDDGPSPLAALFRVFNRDTSMSTRDFPSLPHIPAKTIIIALVLLFVLFKSIVVVRAGHTGVRILFGDVRDSELSAGLHIVNPLESVHQISVQTQSYTMTSIQNEGQVKGADQIEALTQEGLSIDLDITVQYRIDEKSASEIYKTIGSTLEIVEEKIVRPGIRSGIRGVVARYEAKAIYSDKRTEVEQEILKHLESTVVSRGIIIEEVLLRNVTLPSGLANSIQEKLQAEQDAERLDFVLQREEKEAERKRIEAQGQSDAQAILNQTLSQQYLQYLYINELKDREGTIYIPTGNNGLPLLKNIP